MLAHNAPEESLPWDPALHTADGLHPNATGQTVLAQAFARAFHDAGILPAQPAAYRQREWSPNLRPNVSLRGNTLAVDFTKNTTEIRVTQLRVWLHKYGRQGSFTPWYRYDTAGINRTLSKGTWYVRIQPRRYRMVGRVGEHAKVVVR